MLPLLSKIRPQKLLRKQVRKGCDAMEFPQNLTYIWNIGLGRKSKSQYIPNDVVDCYNISSTQKNSAKRAIIWLLSKAPHSVEEIADHFEMTPQLVGHLIEELHDVKLVTRDTSNAQRFKLKSDKEVGEVS